MLTAILSAFALFVAIVAAIQCHIIRRLNIRVRRLDRAVGHYQNRLNLTSERVGYTHRRINALHDRVWKLERQGDHILIPSLPERARA